jgi:glycosyltransferase involved in cell wall biosynthesis
MHHTELSLIICSKDRERQLERCLMALPANELVACQGELVLVNNASSDQTQQVMQEYQQQASFPVKVIEEPQPGLGRARNTGLRHAEGDVIILSDDDCYFAPDYFTKAGNVFDSEEFYFCGGRILPHDLGDATYGCNFHNTFRLHLAHRALDTGVFQGCNLVIHRKVFDRIGEFDESLGAGTPFRSEDVDFCAKAIFAGFAGAHVPELVVFHHHERRDGLEIERLDEANVYARGAYYAKWIQRGHVDYLRVWLRHALSLGKWRRTLTEIRGAWDYWRASKQPSPEHRLGMPNQQSADKKHRRAA